MARKNDDLADEKKTLLVMVRIYCSAHHRKGGREVCDDCRQLIDYAFARLDKCRFGIEKPVCSKCTVHCYKPEMRDKVRKVMRYSGPRMALRHPFRAISHLFHSFRKP